ncbi:MAG: outer membrane protein assembly factor BamE [Alphaproteobacteria bacterium]|nr:outer membrane protein assembly factor BamE [Alphaproteobacteria bacterium]
MKPRFSWTRFALFALTLLLASCGSLKDTVSLLPTAVQPYRVEIVQGNVVTREQLAVLRPGLSRNQVRDVLGSPLITSLFHAQRWDYAFAIRRQGAQPLQRHVSVYFEGDRMTRVEADELPSEAEFTARIDTQLKGKAKAPKLQASEEDLKRFPPKSSAQPEQAVMPPVNVQAYPPLESP